MKPVDVLSQLPRSFAGIVGFLLTVALGGLSLPGAEDPAPNKELTAQVVTFNIRYDNPSDGPNAWPQRRDWVAEILRESQADVIGLQEVLAHQLDELAERLPEYEFLGVGRDDGQRRGEFSPMLIHKNRWKVVASKTWWLSESPEEVGSRGWDAALPRIATYVELESRHDGRRWHVVNTHFDHRGAKARLESAKLLARSMAEQAEDRPWILMGDLNATIDDEPLKALLATIAIAGSDEPTLPLLQDAYQKATERGGPDSTWNGFREIVPGQRIDHVLVSPTISVIRYDILDEQREGRFASDHLPVLAKIRLFESQ